PFVYLLAKKLIGVELSGWIAVSLFSVTAYIHFYSHDARYITLCIFLIISCSYFLLKATERNQFKWWLGYVITGLLALYSSAILVLLIFSHLLYVLFFQKKIIPSFLISISIILLVYLPWSIFIINSYAEVSGAMAWHEFFNKNFNALILIYYQLMMMSRALVSLIDLYNGWNFGRNGEHLNTLLNVFIAIFIIISIVYAKRKMKRESFYFLLFMLLPSFLFFLLTDLIRGAGTSLLMRYHYLNILAILFFLTFFFTRKITHKKITYFAIYAGIAALGIVSVIRISQSKTWDIYPVYDFAPLKYIENSASCLLISDFTTPVNNGVTAFLMVINEIETENVDILYTLPDNLNIKTDLIQNKFDAIFVLYASEQLLENLKSQFEDQLTQIESPELYNPFWQIKIPPNTNN
ncbi:MAG: glycosyltransferase family 39 protein, partial [Bacteroidales bacterium]|nr:glycosyltransferase family 39 protein [Bacteroidales bacterium]